MPPHQDQSLSTHDRTLASGVTSHAVVDRQLSVIELDDRFATLGGVSVERARGQPLTEALPLLASTLAPVLRRVLATGEPQELVELPGGPDQPPLRLGCFPVRSRSGTVLAVDLVAQTLPPEEPLPALTAFGLGQQLDSALFRQLVGIIGGVFWISDPARRVLLYVSPAFEEIWGFPLTDLYADWSRWIAAVHPDDRARVERAIRYEVYAGNYDLEYRVLRPDGTLRWIHDRAAPIGRPGGLVTSISGLAEDITARKQAERALHARDEQLRIALRAGQIGTWQLDLASRQVQCSSSTDALFGLPPDDGPRVAEDYFARIHPDDRARVEAIIATSVRDGTPHAVDYRVIGPDGAPRWLASRGELLCDPDGLPHTLVGALADITARVAGEARDRLLLHLLDATRSLSEPEQIMAVSARLLGAHLQADRCAYAEVAPDENHFIILGDYTTPGTSSIVGHFAMAAFGAEALQLMRAGQPFVVADATQDPRVEALDVYVATQIAAVVCVPLCKGERFVAGLAVHQRVPRLWSATEIELVELVAHLCWESIERTRVARTLRESEAHFRTLAASLPQLIWTATPDGAVDFLSEQWRDYIGCDPDTLLGWGWQHIIHPDDLEHTSAVWREHLLTGALLDIRHRFRHRNGMWRWQLVRALPFRDERGQIARWFGTCTDIHDQTVAAHDAQFLAELAEQARLAEDVPGLFGALVRRVGMYLDVPRCYIAEMNEQVDQITIAHEYSANGLPLAGVYRLSDYPEGALRVGRGSGAVWVEDIHSDPRTAPLHTRVYDPLGICAYLVVPAMRAERWVANLVVATSTPRVWQPREVALLETVAERLWLAGEKLRLDAALRASQANLALALQAGRAGTFTWDIQSDHNSWSPELEALYDLPPGSFGGDYRAWAARVVPEDVQAFEVGLAAVLNTRQGAFAYEFRAILPGGARRWLAGRARFEYDTDGTPLRMRGLNIDIQERKQTELNAQFLLDLDALVARLTEPEVIEQTVVDCLGAYLDLGRCYFEHMDESSVMVRHEWQRYAPNVRGVYRPTDYFSPEVIAQFQANIDCVVADVSTDARTTDRLAAYQALGIGAFVTTPVLSQGRQVGALNIVSPGPRVWRADEVRLLRDVAARIWPLLEQARVTQALRVSEEQLQRLYAQEQAARALAEEASRLKDEFLATLSHELRTPLTTVLGYGQLLQSRKRHEPDTLRVVSQIVQSAKVQAQLIEDLLDVSRIVTGKLRLERQPLDLALIIVAAVETVRPALEAKELRLDLQLDDTPPVSGDPTRLQQVVWNLLFNAVKFTPAGGTVAVRLGQSGASVQICVSDTGRGIDPAFLPFVFDRFRQADGTSSRQHGGLGLGLSIVRHLVELHGGVVAAESAGINQGARFTVELPVQALHATAAPDSAANSAVWLGDCPPELSGLRVLVVDDQPEIGQMLQEVLVGCGALVEVCIAARDALVRLEQWRPQVLVSDIAMPEQDGYWLIEQLRSLPPERAGATPAVALTAYVRVEDRARVLAAGFQRYVPKPVEPAELLAVVAGLVQAGE